MSYIIGSPCVDVCDSACVSVCPVDCIHGPINPQGMSTELNGLKQSGDIKNLFSPQLYIDPETCIDCGACEPECPVDAIWDSEEEAIQNGEIEYVNKNYEFFGYKFQKPPYI